MQGHAAMEERGRGGATEGLFAGLLRSVGELVRAEINLATTEMTGKATRVGKDAGLVAAGGAVAYAGSLAIVAALVRLLERFLPRWLAALIVGLGGVGAGAALVRRGMKGISDTDLAPERTIESIKSLGE